MYSESSQWGRAGMVMLELPLEASHYSHRQTAVVVRILPWLSPGTFLHVSGIWGPYWDPAATPMSTAPAPMTQMCLVSPSHRHHPRLDTVHHHAVLEAVLLSPAPAVSILSPGVTTKAQLWNIWSNNEFAALLLLLSTMVIAWVSGRPCS